MVKTSPILISDIPIQIKAKPGRLLGIQLNARRGSVSKTKMARNCSLEIKQYLGAKRKVFSRFPLEMSQLGSFTRRVLELTAKIPYGKTLSYTEVAKRAGSPKGARAAGQALHRNPFPILIPCHRVIAKTGEWGGFSAGVNVKRKLLKLEGVFAR